MSKIFLHIDILYETLLVNDYLINLYIKLYISQLVFLYYTNSENIYTA